MIAWLVYQRAMNDVVGRQPHDITAETFNFFNKRNFLCATYSRKHLEEIAEAESEFIRNNVEGNIEVNVKGMRYSK